MITCHPDVYEIASSCFCISGCFVRTRQPSNLIYSKSPWWPSKETSVLSQKQMRKVPDRQTKVACRGYSVHSWLHGTLSINMKPQNLWFKLCLSILITEKNFLITLCGFFRGMTSRSTEKRPRFCTSLHIFGMWGDVEVSNMNERLKESAF